MKRFIIGLLALVIFVTIKPADSLSLDKPNLYNKLKAVKVFIRDCFSR